MESPRRSWILPLSLGLVALHALVLLAFTLALVSDPSEAAGLAWMGPALLNFAGYSLLGGEPQWVHEGGPVVSAWRCYAFFLAAGTIQWGLVGACLGLLIDEARRAR